jgi:hypothetical protein
LKRADVNLSRAGFCSFQIAFEHFPAQFIGKRPANTS